MWCSSRETGGEHFFIRLQMTNVVGLGLFAIGVVLLILGLSEADSLVSGLARLLSWVPGDRHAWMVGIGIMAVFVGFLLAIKSAPRREP